MAAPTLVGSGAFVANTTGNITVVKPTGLANNDILLIGLTLRDNVACSLPAGWTQILATNNGSSMRTEWWWFRSDGTDSGGNVVVTHTAGSRIQGRCIAFRGCRSGNPIAGSSSNPSSGAVGTATATGFTPDTADTAWVAAFHADGNVSTATVFSGTNPTFTNQWNNGSTGTTASLKCDAAVGAAGMSTAAASGNRTVTHTSATDIAVLIALASVSAGGGSTYTKQNAASPHIAESAYVASGGDAKTSVETGTGVSPNVAFGGDAKTSVEAGTGVSPNVAEGAKAVVYAKTGEGRMGVSFFSYTKQGAAVSAFTGSGADTASSVEAGPAVSAFTGSGAKAKTSVETGLALSAHEASAAKAATAAETGFVLSVRAGSGADTAAFAEAGLAAAPFSASGPKSLAGGTIYQKQNAAVAVFTASGGKAKTSVETGAAVAAFSASGPKTVTAAGVTYTKQGVAVMGATVNVIVKTGAAVSARTVSGTKTVGAGATYAKAGAAVMGVITVPATVKTGLVVSARTASGADTVVFVEASDGLEFPEPPSLDGDNPAQMGHSASGQKIVTVIPAVSKAGLAVSDHAASGVSAPAYAESGAGVQARVAAGSKSVTSTPGGTTFSKTGVAFSVRTGSGADTTTFVETGGGGGGFGIPYGSGAYGSSTYGISGGSERNAFGAHALVYGESGLGILERAASGSRAATPQKAGTGIATMAAAGSQLYSPISRYAKTGTAIISFNTGGSSAGTHRWLEPQLPSSITLSTMVATTVTLTPKTVDTSPLLTPKPEDSH